MTATDPVAYLNVFTVKEFETKDGEKGQQVDADRRRLPARRWPGIQPGTAVRAARWKARRPTAECANARQPARPQRRQRSAPALLAPHIAQNNSRPYLKYPPARPTNAATRVRNRSCTARPGQQNGRVQRWRSLHEGGAHGEGTLPHAARSLPDLRRAPGLRP